MAADDDVIEIGPDVAEAIRSYPRQAARTRRFTLGEPRDVVVSPDGRRIVMLRSRSGTDPVNCLWVVDAETGVERVVADPEMLLGDGPADDLLPPEERARRERAREMAGGITSFATDAALTVAAFALAGRLFVAGLISGRARELPVAGPVFDPRPDPIASRVAYVSGRLLCVGELDGGWRVVAGGDPDEPDGVSWGSAEFIAAEEMDRSRGYWWSPDGSAVAATRVDTTNVTRWHLTDPSQPAVEPTELAYPAAGTPNADVSLHLIGLDGNVVDVDWDRESLPYLARADWSEHGLIITVQSRDQRRVEVLDVDPRDGRTSTRWVDDDEAWVELVAGTPQLALGGRLVATADRDGARRLVVDGEPITAADLQVRSVVTADDDRVVFLANPLEDATVLHVWQLAGGEVRALTDEPGIHDAAAGGATTLIRTATVDETGATWATLDGVVVRSEAVRPGLTPRVLMSTEGVRSLATAVLLPHDRTAGDGGPPLPVLLDPYGGPHAQRVVRSADAFVASQWFAEQGFAVVVVDGRGTPGRGSLWERSVRGDLATAILDDQVEALYGAAARHGVLDLGRVAIRGWSFGGYLAALAVMRRPDVFHAAVAGAPVTEWRLYDTHYTERYLGDPSSHAEQYDASSLLPLAGDLTRPLLLIHGLADDNVVAAHTLQLSSALLAAGRPHEVLPLVGVTHMTPQEAVAENLLLHQLAFLRRSLGLAPADGYGGP